MFQIGDEVGWIAHPGWCTGTIQEVLTENFLVAGRWTHHATPENPQYAILSSKSDHVAYHYGKILRLLQRSGSPATIPAS